MKKTKRSIDFTAPQMDFLSREAERLGLSVGEVVRRIIDRVRKA